MRRTLGHAGLVLGLSALLGGCDLGLPAGRAPHREGNRLDMIDQPRLKVQRAELNGKPLVLEPPAGTIAVDDYTYPYAQNEADKAGAELVILSLHVGVEMQPWVEPNDLQ